MNSADFALHPRLAADTYTLGDLPLCRLLLMNDANYPWFILVPRRQGATELHRLVDADQQQLMRESCVLAAYLAAEFAADRMNIAALGNVVPQLHVHHVVRYASDPAWPAPVWGRVPARPYTAETLARQWARLDGLRALVPEWLPLATGGGAG
ncbi:MAG: HIT domain-containing protein [Thiotrichales bacterium]